MRILLSFAIFCFLMSSVSCRAQSNEESIVRTPTDIISRLKAGEHVVIQDQTIKGDIDLTEAGQHIMVGDKKLLVEISGQLTAINCVFTGNIIGYKQKLRSESLGKDAIARLDWLHGLSFMGCEFDGDVLLREATVRGDVNFSGAQFHAGADFQGIQVRGQQFDFSGCLFKEAAKFQRIDVLPNASFRQTKLEQGADFQRAIFRSDLMMGALESEGYLGLNSVQARGSLYMNLAKINGRMLANNAHVHSRFEMVRAGVTDQLSFQNTVFGGRTRLMDVAVTQPVDFSGAHFAQVPPVTFTFDTDNAIRQQFNLKDSNLKE